ncbi:MAG: HlyD family efflux transporter periplasmic adaptor subunit [Lentisphaerae bacterium]|nr:HlyD family efflux transporter periplasmic adaptor subunit [Lentisphaerota bacterium]
MKKIIRLILGLAILAVLVYLAVLAYRKYAGPKDRVMFRTDTIRKTDLVRSITATGTVEPEELVNVGAQVQGMITKFGPDTKGKPVDYGSIVKEGGVLAWIDDSLYAAELRSAQASQLQAKASINSANSNILQAKARLQLAELNMNRAKQLRPTNAIAQNTYDEALADHDVAKANLAVAEASLAQAQAQLASANAAQERAARNLSYCVIKSPVNGVIIDRRVNIGQTVVSSMNAPSLFLIAKDLKRMQVWVSVNEADVGQIKVGLPVQFTVDAFQNRMFKGTVRKVRLNATMSQNVVTYVVEVETDNSDGTLLPYLTANVKFLLAQRQGVLAVPNAAFRFSPSETMIPPAYKGELDKPLDRKKRERRIWVQHGNSIKPLVVTAGLNDGSTTEVSSPELKEGMVVVTGQEIQTAARQMAAGAGGENRSPFLPSMPRRQRTQRRGAR